jgi:hypothetical protein
MQNFNCGQMRALSAVASAKAGVRVQLPLQICLGSRSKSKKCDKQLTHIVRVGVSLYLLFKYLVIVGKRSFFNKKFDPASRDKKIVKYSNSSNP